MERIPQNITKSGNPKANFKKLKQKNMKQYEGARKFIKRNQYDSVEGIKSQRDKKVKRNMTRQTKIKQSIIIQNGFNKAVTQK